MSFRENRDGIDDFGTVICSLPGRSPTEGSLDFPPYPGSDYPWPGDDPAQGSADTLQKEIVALGVSAFGDDSMRDPYRRGLRFLEEACELVQAIGLTRVEAHGIVNYVYDRPVESQLWKEFGGVYLSLAALADSVGHSLYKCVIREIMRFKGRIMEIKEREKSKPTRVN